MKAVLDCEFLHSSNSSRPYLRLPAKRLIIPLNTAYLNVEISPGYVEILFIEIVKEDGLDECKSNASVGQLIEEIKIRE